jgi:hypothetical protein
MPEQSRTGDEPPKLRQCGRCRQSFPADPTLPATAQSEWWLCPVCHDTLLGPTGRPTVKQELLLETTP